MDFLRSGVWLTLFWALGEALSRALKLPVPGSVLGMLGLYLCLRLGIVKSDWVAVGARGLLGVLGLLFVPAGAGIAAYGNLNWPLLIAICVALTACAIAITGPLTARLATR